jgi:hypothetical protein
VFAEYWSLLRGARALAGDTGAALGEGNGSVRRGGERDSAAEWRWKGHRVRVVDGAMLTMPDTRENQAEYPQPSSQKPGLGFPIVRIVVMFSLAVGTVLNYALGQYSGKFTGENQLFCLGSA